MESSIKNIVKERYSKIARKGKTAGSCCGPDCCGETAENKDSATAQPNQKASDAGFSIPLAYQQIKGYNEEADLGLGCGLPTEVAGIKKGDTVVDLGSGAGNDCFIALEETGAEGRVIGIDFSTDMLVLAKSNAEKRQPKGQLHFIEGEIESIPLPDNSADVVVSNCVFNLVPDKTKAYQETLRILKAGGHFSISDIVYEGEIPQSIKDDPSLLVECVSGAMEKQAYLDTIKTAGFKNINIAKSTEIKLTADILAQYNITDPSFKLYSVTVNGEKNNTEINTATKSCC